VVLFGVSDLVVVSRGDLTLVTTTDRAADLKTLLDALPPRLRERA
jgi:mannose-1-phosphate guanylyltransferase